MSHTNDFPACTCTWQDKWFVPIWYTLHAVMESVLKCTPPNTEVNIFLNSQSFFIKLLFLLFFLLQLVLLHKLLVHFYESFLFPCLHFHLILNNLFSGFFFISAKFRKNRLSLFLYSCFINFVAILQMIHQWLDKFWVFVYIHISFYRRRLGA